MCEPKVIRLVSVVAPVPPFEIETGPLRLFGSSTVRPVVTPVPPYPTASVPVMEDAPRSTASLFDSITKPPFTFVSTESSCAIVSPDVAPVLVIPLPPVIVEI